MDIEEIAKLLFFLIMVIAFVFAIVIGIAGLGSSVFISEEKEITVQEKIGAHGESGQYLITDTGDNVYTVEDNFFLGSFDASNRYAKLKVNQTYHVKTFGIRNTLLSWYPNIIEFKEVEKQ